MNLPPIPSSTPGSVSRFKGVKKDKKKWRAQIKISSEGGRVNLGTFVSEEEAGIMYARARYKYPVEEPNPCPLDLSDVPMNLPPIPSDTSGSTSRFKALPPLFTPPENMLTIGEVSSSTNGSSTVKAWLLAGLGAGGLSGRFDRGIPVVRAHHTPYNSRVLEPPIEKPVAAVPALCLLAALRA